MIKFVHKNFKALWILIAWSTLSSFTFPNEKKFLAQKVANIEVFDAQGNKFPLYSLIGNKPLIISPVYTKCRSLCGVISNGVQNAVNGLGTLGKDFNMVSFSFDSSDNKDDLAAYQTRWDMDGVKWRTLSASQEEIQRLMNSIDFHYEYNPETKEFNHPSFLVVLTPSGKISRYIYGINPSKRDLELSLIEASAEKTRPGLIKGFYLRCFGYDPITKTYKMDWRFIISTTAGLLIIGIVTGIFLKSFILTKEEE